MDHNTHPMIASFCATISLISAFLAWLTLHDVQPYITLIASLVAMVSGGLAARYYYYSTKKLKKEIKEWKQ